MNMLTFLNGEHGTFTMGDILRFRLEWSSKRAFEKLKLQICVFTADRIAVGVSFTEDFGSQNGENEQIFSLDISRLLPGKYCLELIMTEFDDNENQLKHDVTNREMVLFEIKTTQLKKIYRSSNVSSWGYYELPEAKCEPEEQGQR